MLTCSQAHRGRELCSAIGSCQLGRPAVPHRVWGALCSFPLTPLAARRAQLLSLRLLIPFAPTRQDEVESKPKGRREQEGSGFLSVSGMVLQEKQSGPMGAEEGVFEPRPLLCTQQRSPGFPVPHSSSPPAQLGGYGGIHVPSPSRRLCVLHPPSVPARRG